MSTTQRLEFELEEPGDDATADAVFEILRDFLQPDSTLSLNDAAQQTTEILPAGSTYSFEVGEFLWTCYELAEQIPYDHPSMDKLVEVVHTCLNSSRLVKATEEKPEYRYVKLAETCYDYSNSSDPSEGTPKFINYQTIEALLHSRGMLRGPSPFMHWIFEQAFGQVKSFFRKIKPADRPAAERDAWIQAAAQWMVHQGDGLYAQIATGELKHRQWNHWHESFEAVAAGKAESQTSAYSQETMHFADRAAVAMTAFEKGKIGYGEAQELPSLRIARTPTET